ncbi:hypothetical protein SAMN04488065_0152 [Haloplanus vescus]|uniref:Uncharacterized protein n=1 Tax=Haloplanus vescus TaxID=555874 RepID=A0A1H3VPL0_9EURY|nr:hypothetical protein [Haloplanus vescus]SDZ76716.1 hypothetical protein SAMN04488065_0152 [Haloplanus vescus]
MGDDKSGREKQARDADRRQRERDVADELERGDEPEPPVDSTVLDELESELDSLDFPATGADIVSVVGNRNIESNEASYAVEELVPAIESEAFDSPAAVRVRIQRPTVAAAMKRVLEAADTLPNTDLSESQRDAYEKTFRELKAIDPDDDDEGIPAVADWIVERIREKETLPGSRAVRRHAATFCRQNGYEIRDDEWLGI